MDNLCFPVLQTQSQGDKTLNLMGEKKQFSVCYCCFFHIKHILKGNRGEEKLILQKQKQKFV